MNNDDLKIASLAIVGLLLSACGGSNSVTDDNTVADDDTGNDDTATLNDAYLWFGANVTVALDGNEVVIEATGRPDHTSAYWNPDNASGLYVEPDPAITTASRMSPGYIEEYDNLFTLRVPASPTLAATSSATSLGPVGIAVSGAPIFNDQEGPNIALNVGVISGFDRNGAHTGPSTYHYHLEPKAITNDDDSLVGVIADGFFLFGRQCYTTPGTYPTDLDISGGHTSETQYSMGEQEYHYHIVNETYLGAYYLLFAEDYQGTPNTISN
ncbi:MAG: YHYH protein [Woeseiaceae bacterium]